MDRGLIGGSTVMMLLSLLEEKDCYGYEIIKEIGERSQNVFRFKEGTLYPVLHRMETEKNGNTTGSLRWENPSLRKKRGNGTYSAVLWNVY